MTNLFTLLGASIYHSKKFAKTSAFVTKHVATTAGPATKAYAQYIKATIKEGIDNAELKDLISNDKS